MNLPQQIDADLKSALKAKDAAAALVLRSLKASLRNAEIAAQRKEMKEEDVLAVIQREAKRRRESIEAFEKGGRSDLVAKEKNELSVLEKYLPKQMSQEGLRELVKKCIASFSETPTMGQVMGQLMPQVRGRADGKMVQTVVKELLS